MLIIMTGSNPKWRCNDPDNVLLNCYLCCGLTFSIFLFYAHFKTKKLTLCFCFWLQQGQFVNAWWIVIRECLNDKFKSLKDFHILIFRNYINFNNKKIKTLSYFMIRVTYECVQHVLKTYLEQLRKNNFPARWC